MSESNSNNNQGETDYYFVCTDCGEKVGILAPNEDAAIAILLSRGWKSINGSWSCPDCLDI